MRDTEFYGVPRDGDAAWYYDPDRAIPSEVPYGAEFVDQATDWTPRNSVAREPSDSIFGTRNIGGPFVESPMADGETRAVIPAVCEAHRILQAILQKRST